MDWPLYCSISIIDEVMIGFTNKPASWDRDAALTHRPDNEFTNLWHLHNQYITHMVAFGIFGLLFLVGLLALFPFSGSRGGDEGVKRFSYVAPGLVAMYMLAAKLFSGSPLYGVVFVLLGIVLFANTETEISPARST
jgi:O-antigen ligase